MKCRWVGLAVLLAVPQAALAIGQERYVLEQSVAGSFTVAEGTSASLIYVEPGEFPGVLRAAGDLRDDIQRVSAIRPALVHQDAGLAGPAIIVGTIGRSRILDQLAHAGKIDLSPVRGKWESFLVQVVEDPAPGVPRAVVIAGSDKRGTIFGLYDLSEQMGVSPWYWWADVPTPHRDGIYIKPGVFVQGEPSVKYRGIFLNDEAPDLTNWVEAKFGAVPGRPGVANYNSRFYAHIFETILRLKGNYLWPAMWNNAFNEDDPENPRLADEYGIVMGTSHQEPMLRAQKEWDRGPGATWRNWNYNNVEQRPGLEEFWRQGVRRNKAYENIYTMGLRAENDSGDPIGAALTEQIVGVQRRILAEEIDADLAKVPQMWCLYKEVQGYYEQGLRVPGDITLLWADDNWGNLRRLPTEEERKRAGGAGIYYHIDYHGGPRNYQWINSTPISKIREQMTQAKEYGADRIWIVNVGHFKGQELPMEYFLGLGWNTSLPANQETRAYTRMWVQREFGSAYAGEIADIVEQYTRFNARRKPELIDPATYSQVNYQEAERIAADYDAVAARAQELSGKLPENRRDAFYELVLFPALASANLNNLYMAAGRNALYARQGRASAGDWADRVEALFQKDAELTRYYNKTLAGGKWDHFMDQVHIGYTSWNEPRANTMPRVQRTEPVAGAMMAVAVEGSAAAWPGAADMSAALPRIDALNRQKRWIDVFNRGTAPFEYSASASVPWIVLSSATGRVEKDARLWVSIDWDKAPRGAAQGKVTISRAGGETVEVSVTVTAPADVTRETLRGFAEEDGYVSMEAEHFTRAGAGAGMTWEILPDYGRTLSAVASEPALARSAEAPGSGASLEYRVYLHEGGRATVYAYAAPSLNNVPGRGVRYAVAVDEEKPQVVTLVPAEFSAGNGTRDWEDSVRNEIRLGKSTHTIAVGGYHTLKIWSIDPNVVLEKFVMDLGGTRPSYLGPPESLRR